MIRFLTFSQFHNKRPPTGSTHIRVNQLIKYWPEAALYRYGENPDVLIFQKVYATQDYKFPLHFENKKILDICDPDWLNGMTGVAETAQAMDAVTCPTEAIARFMRQLTDKPVVVIKDRFDLEVIPPPKAHTHRADTVVWFGYSHNAELLKPAIGLIEKLKLRLLIISNDDPIAYRWGLPGLKEYYDFIKYDERTIYNDLQKADFAILPQGFRPEDAFKSENKTVKAILAGLPVATNVEEVEAYVDPKNRQRYIDNNYASMRSEYDVRNSVRELKELIKQL